MSTPSTPPPRPADDRPGDSAPSARRGGARVIPDADFELMLALRGAARARDLRNRVVRPRLADADDPDAGGVRTEPGVDAPRGLAHPN